MSSHTHMPMSCPSAGLTCGVREKSVRQNFCDILNNLWQERYGFSFALSGTQCKHMLWDNCHTYMVDFAGVPCFCELQALLFWWTFCCIQPQNTYIGHMLNEAFHAAGDHSLTERPDHIVCKSNLPSYAPYGHVHQDLLLPCIAFHNVDRHIHAALDAYGLYPYVYWSSFCISY